MRFLDKIMLLRPVVFRWTEQAKESLGAPDGDDVGLIAQEVEEVFPELVVDSSKGHKAIRYGWLPVYLLRAIQEQQIEIERLKNDRP